MNETHITSIILCCSFVCPTLMTIRLDSLPVDASGSSLSVCVRRIQSTPTSAYSMSLSGFQLQIVVQIKKEQQHTDAIELASLCVSLADFPRLDSTVFFNTEISTRLEMTGITRTEISASCSCVGVIRKTLIVQFLLLLLLLGKRAGNHNIKWDYSRSTKSTYCSLLPINLSDGSLCCKCHDGVHTLYTINICTAFSVDDFISYALCNMD